MAQPAHVSVQTAHRVFPHTRQDLFCTGLVGLLDYTQAKMYLGDGEGEGEGEGDEEGDGEGRERVTKRETVRSM